MGANLPDPIHPIATIAAAELTPVDRDEERAGRRFWRRAKSRARRKARRAAIRIIRGRRRLARFEARMLNAIHRGMSSGWRRLTGRGVSRPQSIDLVILGLAACAFAMPFAGPSLREYSPFYEPNHVRAERSVIVLPDSAPTLWSGSTAGRAKRALTPEWVAARLRDQSPLNVALALATPPRVIELIESPLPSFAQIAAPVLQDLQMAAQLAVEPADPWGDLDGRNAGGTEPLTEDDPIARGEISTASIAPKAPQTAPPITSARPTLRPVIDPQERELELSIATASLAAPPSAEAKAMTEAAGRAPKISILLTAVGLNEAASQAALYNLPPEVAIAVAPVGKRPQDWARAARQSGRQVLVEIPMEPPSYPRLNPGPLTLLTEASASENLDRLAAAMADMPEVDGIATYLGGRFKTDTSALTPVLRQLKTRGLFVFENGGGPTSALPMVAEATGISAMRSTVSLDNGGRSKDIAAGFAQLEREAQREGAAIGVAVALPRTVAEVAEWVRAAESRGFQLTPLQP